jgi:hypothetical protein
MLDIKSDNTLFAVLEKSLATNPKMLKHLDKDYRNERFGNRNS